LTPSRFIVKYKNLYEEIINILSEDKNNNFDLSEIQKNAEICIKRINYELGNIKDMNLDSIPELPENMKKAYKEYESIKEFKGFIPKHIPDQVMKVVYSVEQKGENFIMLYLNYYTTYKELELYRKEKNKEIIEKEENKEENITEEKEDENDNESYIYKIDSKEIGSNENSFLYNFIKIIKAKKKNIIQIEDNSIGNKKIMKSSLIRKIYYNKENNKKLLKNKVKDETNNKDKSNYYISEFWNINYFKENSYSEIFNIYRRNYEQKFVKLNRIENELYLLDKNKITFSTENYFHDDKK
jgi:hypothetical protein